MADFDPYHRWLGIRDPARPPNHYRLLGLDQFEDNPRVIQSAADRQMAHLRTLQTGQHSRLSQRLLNEVAAAKLCLLNPQAKGRYDTQLRARLGLADPSAQPPAPGLRTPGSFQTSTAETSPAETSPAVGVEAGAPRFDSLPPPDPNAADMGEDARQRATTPWWVHALTAAWMFCLVGAIVAIQTWYGGPQPPEPPRERPIIVRRKPAEPTPTPPQPPKKGLAPTGTEPPDTSQKTESKTNDPKAKAPAAGELVELRKLPGVTTSVWGVAAAGRQRVALAAIDRTLRVLDIETGESAAEATADELVYGLAANGNGDRIVFATADGGGWFWNYADELPSRISRHEGACRAAAISPAGSLLASAGEDGLVLVHRLPEGQRVHRWEAHTGPAQAVAFVGEDLLVSGGNDGWIRWWNVQSGEQAKAQSAHPTGVTVLAGSMAAKRVVSADREGKVHVWSLAADRTLQWPAHTGEVKAVAISANGRLLATGGQDTLVRIWDLQTGDQLAQGAHKGPVLGLTFSPAGDWLASCGADSTVRVWEAPRK
jgi:hypothetical protein